MKSKTMILMVIAVSCGLVASYLTSKLLSQQTQAAEKVKVWVAKQKIGFGVQIKKPEDLFVEKEFIKGQEPRLAITKLDDLKDKRVNKIINQDVHVTPEDFFDPNTIGIVGVLAKGYRAVAIRVNADTNVAGFVMPNTHVDVLCTYRGDGAQSRIILEDVLVLAADMQDQREDGKKAMAANTVTLQLKPDDVEKIRMAQAMGELSLSLRPYGETEKAMTRGKKPRDVFQGTATDGSEPTADSNPNQGNGGGSAVPNKIPDVPEPAKEEKVEKPGEKFEVAAARPAKKDRHVMVITNGQYSSKAIFEKNDDGEIITREEGRRAPEPTPARTSETAPEGASAKPEAKSESKPESKPEAKPEGKSEKSESKTDGKSDSKSDGKATKNGAAGN